MLKLLGTADGAEVPLPFASPNVANVITGEVACESSTWDALTWRLAWGVLSASGTGTDIRESYAEADATGLDVVAGTCEAIAGVDVGIDVGANVGAD